MQFDVVSCSHLLDASHAGECNLMRLVHRFSDAFHAGEGNLMRLVACFSDAS